MPKRKPVKSNDPRKADIKAALIRKAGAGSKVTMVTENTEAQTFTGRVMERDPNRKRCFRPVAGGATTTLRTNTTDSDGYFTVTAEEVKTPAASPQFGDESEVGRWYVTLYQHSWGRGRTPEESKAEAKKAGGRGTAWFTKRLPVGADKPTVNELGGISWEWLEGHEPENDRDRVVKLDIVAAGRGMPKDVRAEVVA